MAPRYVVRRQDNLKYCVWDYQIEAVAKAANREFGDLAFGEALDVADSLNSPSKIDGKGHVSSVGEATP